MLKMKKLMLLLIAVGICTSVSFAGYTYVSNTYGPVPNLSGNETLLVTGQGGDSLIYLSDFSYANIQGTSLLQQSVGGIWEILLANNSHLDMSGGELHELSMNNNATATLSNCLIQSIYSTQGTWKWNNDVDPPVTVPNPHITFYHSGAVPTVQEIGGFDYLVGSWIDGTDFQIYLHDTGYDVYDNFNFIPEPMTLAFLGLGGLLIRRKK